ncbi:MAG: N-acetyltransferase [Bacteroidaceae bacterium]|nr:N-acetyltransferase [Bacteroidaceae bacterium]
MNIRQEKECDYLIVENMVRESYWNNNGRRCIEHYIVRCFRQSKDFIPELDLVLEEDGMIVGHCMAVRSDILSTDGRTVSVVTLGPFCVARGYRGRGYGSILLQYCVEMAKVIGIGAFAMTGPIELCRPAGFRQAKEFGIVNASTPDAADFLINEVLDGYLDGVRGIYLEPEGYVIEKKRKNDFLRYDSHFPRLPHTY